jgi:azurin
MKRIVFMLALAVVTLPLVHVRAQGTAPAKPAAAAAGAARTVEITATENPMKYSVATIAAKPGEKLRIVLKAVGAMPKMAMAHNFVLLKDTVKPADQTTFAGEAAMAGPVTSYIPAARKDWVIANTELAGAGETKEVTFTVPAKAGSYPFLCSFPGHFGQGMKGTLVVK